MELAELITKSPENFRAAIELREALKFAVEDMRKKFLEAVCERLKHIEPEKLDYAPEKRNYALQYHYDKLPNTVVCLGSGEIDTWVSYYFTGGDKAKPVEFRARLKEYRGDDYNDDYNSVFFYWEYCRLYNGNSPNFYPNDKAPNKAIIELCDDEKFNEFVGLCAGKIKAFLDFSPEDITSLA